MKWDYQWVTLGPNAVDLTSKLDEMGSHEWEAVGVTSSANQIHILMKRPVVEKKKGTIKIGPATYDAG